MSSLNDGAGSGAVYVGFWIDCDYGKVLGARLTLLATHVTVLLAFLAVLTTYAGSRSWKFWRFVLHRAIAPCLNIWETGIPPRRQRDLVLLRNSETASDALWELSFPSNSQKHTQEPRDKRDWTPSLLGSFMAGHILLFLAAGILTSQIVVGRTVVSRVVASCGQWMSTERPSLDNIPAWLLLHELQMNQTLDADNYVRNCYDYGTSRHILDCRKFVTASLAHTTDHDAPCPFPEDICITGNKSFAMDSGPITFASLGINSRFARDVSIRRRSTCASVFPEPFELKGLTNNTESESYYLFDNITGNPLMQLQYFTHHNISVDYDIRAFNLGNNSTQEIRAPLRLDMSSHTVSVVLLSGMGIRFTSPTDDPFFSAHQIIPKDLMPLSDRTFYKMDRKVNVIGCDEQVQLCSSLTGKCLPWQGLWTISASNNVLALLGGLSLSGPETHDLYINLVLLQSLLVWTGIPFAIEYRPAAAALQAGRYFYQSVQFDIGADQWKRELNYWFSMGLARLQLELFNTIEKPPQLDADRAVNLWVTHNLTGMCGKVKFNSAGHTTLSALGLGLVLGLSGLLVAASFADVVTVKVLRTFGKGSRVAAWEECQTSALLEVARVARRSGGGFDDPFLVEEVGVEECAKEGASDRYYRC